MGLIDRLFTNSKQMKALELQVKQLQRRSSQVLINASTSIFPNWQILEAIDTYVSVDDVYSVISYLADTAARIPMYGYKIVNDNNLKSMRKHGQLSIQGKYYRQKALIDLGDSDKFEQFIKSVSYEDRVKYYSILYITGELFLYKEVLELGPNAGTIQLHALNNENVTVIISDTFPQRVLGYQYLDAGFDGTLSVDEVIHVKYYNPTVANGQQWRGLSPLKVLAKRLTRLNAGMDASVAQMQNGGVPGIVYEKSDYAIESLGQRKTDFASYLRNSSNKGAPYFAAGEMGYIELGLSLADLDVVELQKIDFTKLCNAYKFPEVLLNNQQASTYDNMNTAMKMLYTNSILPNIHLFRDALIEGVIPHYSKDGIKRTIEIDLSDVPALQDDMKAQADALSAMWWVTPNEKRQIQHFEALPDPAMNEIIVDGSKQFLNDLSVTIPDLPA